MILNFRPISNLPFLSKILEKIVLTQLQSHLMSNNILEKFQSGFKSQHSTETALLNVVNYLLLETDRGYAVALVLLDLSSAFDMVDHNILISRLESCVGLEGKVLKWFQSFLTNRSFSVSIGQHSSSSHPLACGVPRGSVLAPVLFSIFMLPMGDIFENLFADDTQLYFLLQHKSKELSGHLLNCINELQIWLKQNLLVLNENKTEIILFGSKSYEDCALHFGHLSSYFTTCGKNRGVLFDCNLGFEKQISLSKI